MSAVAAMMSVTTSLAVGADPVFQEFTSTGSTTYTIPAGISTLRIRAWGSGGAGCDVESGNIASKGGGTGGFAEAYVDVSGQTSITVIVASGTSGNQGNGASTPGTGIGTGADSSGGGDGGAGSGIKFGSTMVLVAGGGGGSSAGNYSGGGGGGVNGNDGEGGSLYFGGGAIGSSGGTRQGGGGNGGNAGTGTNGGGNGGSPGGATGNSGGGAGGGGYAGGAGGDGGNSTRESGGGGGSGYANATYCTNITLTAGGTSLAVPQSSLLPTGGTGTYAAGGQVPTSTSQNYTAYVQGKQGCVIIDNDNGKIV